MKALSIKQPYIDWIRSGQKTLEIRSWRTNNRGNILLCSSRKAAYKQICEQLMKGYTICIVELLDVFPFLPEHTEQAMIDHVPNHFAWQFRLIKEVSPEPVKGKLGFFHYESTALSQCGL